MSFILHDPDEWEVVTESRPCGSCGGDLAKCNGMCTGMASFGHRRRSPEEVSKIKADREAARIAGEEAAISAGAWAIVDSNGCSPADQARACIAAYKASLATDTKATQ